LNPSWKRLCTNCNITSQNVRFSSGSHDIIIKATDKAGNSAQLSRTFNIIS